MAILPAAVSEIQTEPNRSTVNGPEDVVGDQTVNAPSVVWISGVLTTDGMNPPDGTMVLLIDARR